MFGFISNKLNINESIGKGKKSQLPLYYKDKPAGYKPRRFNKVMLFKGFIISLGLYVLFLAGRNQFGGRNVSFGPQNWKNAQEEVRQAFLESWHTYEKYGWGKDIYHPISQRGENMGDKPLGWMIVDSLDTLMIMGADEEVERARKWVKEDLSYKFDVSVNLFETTIRMLGGLLSAFHFSEDDVYLDKAVELATNLLGGFDSESGIPYSSVNLLSGKGIKNHADNGASSTAEVTTLQLEFKYLAFLTGEADYWTKVEKIMELVESNKPEDGLVPIYVHPDTGRFQGNLIRLGSRGDSYYEYLLKQYLQTKKQEDAYWDMYKESVSGVQKHLVKESFPNSLTYVGEREQGIHGPFSPKMDHLVCFYGGLLALGATGGVSYDEAKKSPEWTPEKESHFRFGEKLTYTCYKMYKDVPSGLSPEIVVFNEDPTKSYDFYIKPADRHNLQRPETVESLFYLYRLTGDEKYRQYGYEIFQNFIRHTKVVNDQGDVSYTSLRDITTEPVKLGDNTESFWFAETLKYLYLLFDDENKVPLDEYVFNTEAHPFPTFDLTETLKTNWRRKIDPSKIPDIAESKAEYDIKHPPPAAPVNKPLDQQAQEEVNLHPDIAQ